MQHQAPHETPHAPAPETAEPDVVEVALTLMRAESTSGAEGPAVDAAEALLAGRGWRTRRIAVTPGRDNVFAEAPGRPAEVVLSTHLDTVPPHVAPRLEGGRLWGRGACDAKGIAAAMVCAAERLRARGVPVGLLFVVGEEITHDGAHAADAARAEVAPRARALVNGEPTESALATGTKGALRFVLRVRGRAAHSAYPHLGESATGLLAGLVVDLEAAEARGELPHDPVLGATTVNLGGLAGGVADNVVAPWAEARCMARLVVGADETRAALDGWLAARLAARGAEGRAELVYSITVPPVRLTPVPGFRSDVVAFATDIPALAGWGTPYLFGPGSIHVAHTDGEYVEVAELRAAVGAYERLAEAALDA